MEHLLGLKLLMTTGRFFRLLGRIIGEGQADGGKGSEA